MCVCAFVFAYANTGKQTEVHVVDMAPGCRTIFMLMSADGEYSFENTSFFMGILISNACHCVALKSND